MPITLSTDTRKQLIESLKHYAAEHLDDPIGDLKAGLLLDFCLVEIGAVVYNQAIADAQAYFQERTADLDGVCHQLEFTYWKAPGKTRWARPARDKPPSVGPHLRPMPVRFRRLTAALGSVLWAALASDAFAQGALPSRILQIEDARELSVASQAVLSEGLKDPSPHVRAQAVRAMGRFESPALVGKIVPLLGDADPGVRHAAAVAAANAAKVFPGQAIEALAKAMGTAPPADWAVLASSLGRIALPGPADFTAAEQAIAAGLPTVELRAQVVRPTRPAARPTDPVRVEGAARGLEALVRVNGTLGTLAADTRSRLVAVVETQQGAPARGLTRARRLALLALRNARAVDGALTLVAAKDPDDEVRRLAMTAAAAARPTSPPSPTTRARRCCAGG